MSQSDRSTIDVYTGEIGFSLTLPGQYHAGECLVNLDAVDVVERESSAFQYASSGRNGSTEHKNRVFRRLGKSHKARQRTISKALGSAPLNDQDGRRAISDWRRVASGH